MQAVVADPFLPRGARAIAVALVLSCDSSDLSWQAEDRAIQAAATLSSDLDAQVAQLSRALALGHRGAVAGHICRGAVEERQGHEGTVTQNPRA